MAKKPKSQDSEKTKTGTKKKVVFLVILIIIILLLVIPVLLIKLNVMGLGTKLSGPLGNVPVVKSILPSTETDSFANVSKEELATLNQNLEETNLSYTEIIETLNSKIEELNSEISRLREVEEQQVQFKADKEEFDRLIALNDPSAYASFYENISPENAEELYKEAILKTEETKEFKTYAQTFENMKKDSAANVLQELISSDIDLVVRILEYLSSEKRADILSAMDSKNAAMCVKMMSPNID